MRPACRCHPKTLIMDLRDALPLDQPPRVVSRRSDFGRHALGLHNLPRMHGGLPGPYRTRAEDHSASSACGTEEDRIPRGLQDALSNIGRSGNSMGKPARMRARWTKDLPFRVKDAREGPVDVLWFVGDHASYDPRALEVSRRLATLLHTAGVDFGILYDAEQNSGNDVRRCGEEGLFGSLAQSNIAALNACSFRRVLTTDPHALNALRNEYQSFGVSFDVIHHTALLSRAPRCRRD